jgi:dinuclear metal center YbgI/SA1388 family protein
MRLDELTHWLDDYLKIADYTDRSNNGLQVQGNPEVTRVAFAVDACLAAFQGATARGAQLLIVHHGLFWSQHLQITGAHYERIKMLMNANCGLYGAHIPLDAHPEVGNNIQLTQMAGLQNIQPWGEHGSDVIGFIGDLPRTLSVADLSKRLEARIGKGNRIVTRTPTASRIAVLSGYGVDFVNQAIAAGADTLITGETSHTWYHQIAELNINVIFGGHYNTETVGVLALARKTTEVHGLDTFFIDLPTGL